MATPDFAIFALRATRTFGASVAAELGVVLAEHEERSFEDGEHKTRSLESVRGRDVFVFQSLHGGPDEGVNDKLCRLLFFLGSLRDAAAERVTAVVPYLCYARKDRKTKSRDPVTLRYLAALFEAVGVDRVVTLEVHNLAAFQNAFRCATEHLEARKLFVEHFAPRLGEKELVVVSPDTGGFKRADAFRAALEARLGRELPIAFMEKQRSAGVVSGETFGGDVAGRTALVVDDLIASGTTMARTAKACLERGAEAVYAAAAHGLFVGDASRVLAHPALAKTVVTDTIPPFRLDPAVAAERLEVISAAPLVAEAIRRLHEGGSLVELLEP
jgi:ribose-phosphate pyrophosphokinase